MNLSIEYTFVLCWHPFTLIYVIKTIHTL